MRPPVGRARDRLSRWCFLSTQSLLPGRNIVRRLGGQVTEGNLQFSTTVNVYPESESFKVGEEIVETTAAAGVMWKNESAGLLATGRGANAHRGGDEHGQVRTAAPYIRAEWTDADLRRGRLDAAARSPHDGARPSPDEHAIRE
jgi:hypothetical protein